METKDETTSLFLGQSLNVSPPYALDSAFSSITRSSVPTHVTLESEGLSEPSPLDMDEGSWISSMRSNSRIRRLAEQTVSLLSRLVDQIRVLRAKCRAINAVLFLIFVSTLVGFLTLLPDNHSGQSSSPPSSVVGSELLPMLADNRSVAFQNCASTLSPKLGCPNSATCSFLEDFFLGIGEKIEINAASCPWNSDFGLVLVLILLREALSFPTPSWFPRRPFLVGEICSWKHISCDYPEIVSKLTLTHVSYLNGTLPTEVGGLVSLTELELYSNPDLYGTIPTEVGQLTNLKSLQLHKTSISGTIPTELGHLTQLNELLIDGTNLKGTMPSEVCAMWPQQLKTPHVSCFEVECKCCGCPN